MTKLKTCTKCKKEKPLDGFHQNRKVKSDGRVSVCKCCAKAINAIRYSKKRDQILDNNRQWRDSNRPRMRELVARHHKNFPERHAALERKRLVQIKQATTAWSDLEAIADIRKYAASKGFVIDHIVPLQSKNVCGLHVVDNIRVVPEHVNSRKGNWHWPDMWGG